MPITPTSSTYTLTAFGAWYAQAPGFAHFPLPIVKASAFARGPFLC